MGHRVGSKLCPLCHRLEDHEHVLRHCRFSGFIFDTVRKAFGVVQREGGGGGRAQQVVPRGTSASLQRTQGLVLWAAPKALWALRCEARFQGGQPSLDDFVARWMGILEMWRTEWNMSLSHPDL